MQKRWLRYPVSPLEAVVLIYNTLHCEEAENDADRTVLELVREIDAFDGGLSKSVLEAGLYNCNMNNEDKKFWHPYNWPFNKFVEELLPSKQVLDRYHGLIKDE